jgi:outer membrane lipoprotein-sorting protein
MVNKRTVPVSILLITLLVCTAFLPSYARGKKKKSKPAPVAAETFVPVPEQGGSSALDKVLTQMDQQAANFKNAKADFVWDQYTKLVDDHDLQEGTIYFRRLSKDEMQMSADINKHNGARIAKVVLFANGMVRLYEPDLHHVTEYNAGKNRAAFESFLVLGFGGSGHDLLKSFDVKLLGNENVQGVNTAKLELTPKSQKVRGMFDHIILWIDPARGVSVQQQFFTADGDYRLAKYNNIHINEKISDEVFKLKTPAGTEVIRPS